MSNPKRNSSQWRKERPLFSGVFKYFPRALLEVAHVSFLGGQKHAPGQPLHWARGLSVDQEDAGVRHYIDLAKGETGLTDEGYRLAQVAWRALAALELHLEAEEAAELAAEKGVQS